jgi:hypothetical protein
MGMTKYGASPEQLSKTAEKSADKPAVAQKPEDKGKKKDQK